MNFSKWTVPLLLRFLSLAGLTSAIGDRAALTLGFAFSNTVADPTSTLSQPSSDNLSLEIDFVVQVANQELKVPIMPL